MENIAALGVIGGSGLYAMEGLSEVREHALETPFGLPSDPIITGVTSDSRKVAPRCAPTMRIAVPGSA